MLKIIRLLPKTGYATDLRSDTLFGILAWGAYWVYGEQELNSWLQDFKNNQPPFIISSAFPFIYVNDSPLCFLPKPIVKPADGRKNGDEDLRKEQFKKDKNFKKLEWITQHDFIDLINGKTTLSEMKDKIDFDKYPIPDILKDQRYYNRFDRITWNSSGEEGQVFQDTVIMRTGEKPGGLYFFVKSEEETTIRKILNILNYWNHVGIGRNASIGLGKFDFEADDPSWLKEPEECSGNITLSLFFPVETEIEQIQKNQRLSWYEIENRKGRVGGIVYKSANPYKKGISMFKEGSSFPVFSTQNPGCIVEVAQPDQFPIYHYGFAFMIKSTLKEIST